MTRLLQISDTHFGTEQPAVMEALVRLTQAQRPDVLILSGDITQRAQPDEFERAKAFCDRLQVPRMLSLPGNHDIPLFDFYRRAFKPYQHYQRFFGGELEPCLTLPDCLVIGVNTTRPWRHKNGEVSRRQIDSVAARLQSATAAQLRIVVVHQPVHVLRGSDEHDRLRGWRAAVQAWAAAGADIVMGGHIHLPYVCDLSSVLGDAARRLWCVQAGTAVSSRIRKEAPNSVNLLHHGARAGRCEVERWDYRRALDRFELAHTTELTLSRDPDSSPHTAEPFARQA